VFGVSAEQGRAIEKNKQANAIPPCRNCRKAAQARSVCDDGTAGVVAAEWMLKAMLTLS
jgi:hypothetical protein